MTKNLAVGNQGPGMILIPGSGASITKGSIYGNDTSGSNCGIMNADASADATGNFRGAANGPGPDPADAVCDSFGGSTTTTPFSATEIRVPLAAIR